MRWSFARDTDMSFNFPCPNQKNSSACGGLSTLLPPPLWGDSFWGGFYCPPIGGIMGGTKPQLPPHPFSHGGGNCPPTLSPMGGKFGYCPPTMGGKFLLCPNGGECQSLAEPRNSSHKSVVETHRFPMGNRSETL